MKNIDLTALAAEVSEVETLDASVVAILQAHSQAIKDAVAEQIKADGFANDQTNTAVQGAIDAVTARFVAARAPLAAAALENTGGGTITPPPPPPDNPPADGQ